MHPTLTRHVSSRLARASLIVALVVLDLQAPTGEDFVARAQAQETPTESAPVTEPAATPSSEGSPEAAAAEGTAAPTEEAPPTGETTDAVGDAGPAPTDTTLGETPVLAPAPSTLELSSTSDAAAGADQGLAQASLTHSVYMTGRLIHLPGGILDGWFEQHANTWQEQANIAAGLEYVLRFVDTLELSFGLFWTDLSMPAQYWLESSKDFSSADYTELGLSVIALEANIYGYWDFLPQLGLFYGGGLWFGGVLGEIRKANVQLDCAESAQENGGAIDGCPYDPVFFDEKAVPPVIGFLSATVGLRALLEEHVVVKLEGGFKGYVYGGLSLGAQFF